MRTHSFTARRDAGTRAAIALLIACLLGAMAAAVGPVITKSAPIAAAAGPCKDEGGNRQFAGNVDSTSQKVVGVYARINLSNHGFATCTSNAGNDFTTAWIAIDSNQTPLHGNSQILQMGVNVCNYYPGVNVPGGCDINYIGQRTPHFWYAKGGCNGISPIAKDLGPADYGSHTYLIQKGSDGYWVGRIDGSQVFRFKGSTDSAISCWQTVDSKRASYMTEVNDEGNTLSNSNPPDATEMVHFDDAAYQLTVGGAYIDNVWTDPCTFTDYSSYYTYRCNVYNGGTNTFDAWSQPNP